MKRKVYLLLIIALAAFNFACGGTMTETTKTNAPTGGNNTPATQTQPKTATIKTSTPSEANESLFNAIKNKDKASVKQLLSKDSLEIMDAAAKEKKMTVDELLDKEFFVNVTLPAKLEQRNEKITGDKATVEMRTDKNEWTPSNFVKEGGAWKVALM
jgi:hypothetical protein